MKRARFVTFFLLVVSLFVIAFVTARNEDDTVDESNEKEDATIELNPEYEASNETNEEVDEEDDDDSGSSEDDEVNERAVRKEAAKSKLDAAMTSSRRRYKKSLQFIKKNRTQITVGLALFAYRREIWQLLMYLLKNEFKDPKTGKTRISLTTMLKLFIFVDFMKRVQSGRNSSQASFQSLAILGHSNPLMGLLFSRVLRFPLFNPAFIPPISQHYTFERINERYVKDGMALHKAIHAKHDGFKWPVAEVAISESMIAGRRLPEVAASNETLVVVEMTKLDTSVSVLDQIRDQVSFLVSHYRAAAMMQTAEANSTTLVVNPLEVVVLLESPGGSAADYGLAAEQLLRLQKEPGITLTICVDKVAASGGYMMACTASPGHLFAAPFAVVGSIGVIGQIINGQKFLEGWNLTPMVFRGGKDKVPVGLLGEVTQEGKDKTQAMIDMTHEAFQQHVVNARPVLKKTIKKVGTGDIYMGSTALNLGLIDKIITSDEYVSSKVAKGARVLKLVKNRRPRGILSGSFDNYDLDVGATLPNLIRSTLSQAWTNTARHLGFGVENYLHQPRSLAPHAKIQTP